MPRSSSGFTLSALTPCGRQPKAHCTPRRFRPSGSNGSHRRSIRPRSDGCSSATAGVPSWREVTASIRAPGCRRRILMSSAAVYPDPPRMATLVMSSEVRGQISEVSLAGGPTARPVSYGTMHSITSAAAAIRRGELTPVDLLDQCLARIDRLEDRVRAWVLVDRDRARADAVRLTDELKRGTDRGPLHGIPIGVKDLFDVFDWPTAAGSKRWAQSYARQDCPTVARLRQAGAVLMGKTVTVAYAAFDPSPTRNPWNPDRTPGGSSSGSAAAIACGMCLGALGTQTGGSITRPASYCGVYGLKPTYGGVSLEGVVPFAPSLDHGGMIGASVRDLAHLIQPILPARGTLPGPADYAVAIGQQVRKSLGLPGGFFDTQAEPVMSAAFARLVEQLRRK